MCEQVHAERGWAGRDPGQTGASNSQPEVVAAFIPPLTQVSPLDPEPLLHLLPNGFGFYVFNVIGPIEPEIGRPDSARSTQVTVAHGRAGST